MDYTNGEMMTMVAPFFGLDPMDIAHVAVIVYTAEGHTNIIGCGHARKLAYLIAHSKTEKYNVANQASHSGTHDDGNLNSPSGKQRKARISRFMSYLQFRARIRYR